MENTTKLNLINDFIGKVTGHLNSYRSIYIYFSWLITSILLVIEIVINIVPHFPFKFEFPRFVDNFTSPFLLTRLVFSVLTILFMMVASFLLFKKLKGKLFGIFYFIPFGLVLVCFIYTSSFIFPSVVLIFALILSIISMLLVLNESTSGLKPSTVFRTTYGGALGALIALGYLLGAVGVVGLLLYLIKLLHQLIVGV